MRVNVKSKADWGWRCVGLWGMAARCLREGGDRGAMWAHDIYCFYTMVLQFIVFFHFLLHFSWHLGWIVLALKFGYFKFHDLMFRSPTQSRSSSLGKLYLCLSSALQPCSWALEQIIHSIVSDVYLFCQQIPRQGSLSFHLWLQVFEKNIIFMLTFIINVCKLNAF